RMALPGADPARSVRRLPRRPGSPAVPAASGPDSEAVLAEKFSNGSGGPCPSPHSRVTQTTRRLLCMSVDAAAADLRASDADRERVADILRDALAEGRLTMEEFGERLDATYAARTYGDLAP